MPDPAEQPRIIRQPYPLNIGQAPDHESPRQFQPTVPAHFGEVARDIVDRATPIITDVGGAVANTVSQQYQRFTAEPPQNLSDAESGKIDQLKTRGNRLFIAAAGFAGAAVLGVILSIGNAGSSAISAGQAEYAQSQGDSTRYAQEAADAKNNKNWAIGFTVLSGLTGLASPISAVAGGIFRYKSWKLGRRKT